MSKILNILEKVIGGIQIVFLFLIFGSIGLQIFSRKLFNKPLSFPEELSMFTLIALVFLGISVIERYNAHIKVEFVYERVSAGIRRTIVLVGQILTFLIILSILNGEKQLIPKIIKLKSKAARIPYIWIHSIIVISCIIWAIIILYNVITHFRKDMT